PLESQYSAAFAAQVEAKHDQAERVEDRLEDLIERQESRMQQAQAKQPGMLALPSTVPSGNSRCSSSKPPCSACTDG
ncbi:hypothetical protein ACFOPN_22795, partial [Xanthomonas hyacinthi]